MSRRVIGLDAGGTKLRAGVVEDSGRVVAQALREWPQDGGREAVLACFAAVIAELWDEQVEAVGAGIPATVDVATGHASACAHLPLADFAFGDWLREQARVPALVDNDSTLAMLAEARTGAARDALEAVMLTIGTGIGGGIVSGGELLRGATGAAGEPGHMTIDADGPPCRGDCPGRGCLETYVSGSALAAAARRPAHEVLADAHAGDADAIALLEGMGEKLGAGIASLLNLLEPQVVVIGGGFGSAAGELLRAPAERVARERALEPAGSRARIVGAELGDEAGMLGAAMLALELL